MSDSTKCNRREFIKLGAIITTWAASIPALSLIEKVSAKENDSAPPAGMQPVSESDPVATAIGFKHNVKDVDYAKYPQRKLSANKNQFCNNCALYTSVNGNWGKCQMLTNGVVSAKGWCGSYNKKS